MLPLFGDEVCSPCGERQPSCPEEQQGQAQCRVNEMSTTPGSSISCPSPFSSCPLQFFIRNVHVCLRALDWPALELPAHLCLKMTDPTLPVQAAPKGSIIIICSITASPTCSSLHPPGKHISQSHGKWVFLLHIVPERPKENLTEKPERTGILPIFINGWEDGRTEPDSSPWCLKERQAMSFKYSHAQNTANII